MKIIYDYRCDGEANELVRYMVNGVGCASIVNGDIGWIELDVHHLEDDEGILASMLLEAVAAGVSITQ